LVNLRTLFHAGTVYEDQEKAATTGMSVSGFLRACGLGRVTPSAKKRVPVDRQILERTIAEMRRIGNNINQIAHASNLNQPADSEQLHHVLEKHIETLKLLREARKL